MTRTIYRLEHLGTGMGPYETLVTQEMIDFKEALELIEERPILESFIDERNERREKEYRAGYRGGNWNYEGWPSQYHHGCDSMEALLHYFPMIVKHNQRIQDLGFIIRVLEIDDAYVEFEDDIQMAYLKDRARRTKSILPIDAVPDGKSSSSFFAKGIDFLKIDMSITAISLKPC